MNRRKVLSLVSLSSIFYLNDKAMSTENSRPDKFYFRDDGKIPNSKLPLLIYRNGFSESSRSAKTAKERFASNNWTNSWDNGVYPFHHYHSTSHEVLGVYGGWALLHLGGEAGEKLRVQAGDVLIIPAGVGHKNLDSSSDFGVVGAYPDGRDWDLLKGEPGDRPKADNNIAALPIPTTDPLFGKNGGLTKIWIV
jgi:uncharacterized protein YjlB